MPETKSHMLRRKKKMMATPDSLSEGLGLETPGAVHRNPRIPDPVPRGTIYNPITSSPITAEGLSEAKGINETQNLNIQANPLRELYKRNLRKKNGQQGLFQEGDTGYST